MARRPAIDILGKGNWGTSLAAALPPARVITRTEWPAYTLPAPLVWLCVPDRELGRTATILARRWRHLAAAQWPQVVLHSSGSLDAEAIAALRSGSTAVGSAHPWMTFPSRKPVALAGVSFALEGDAAAVKAARSLVKSFAAKPFLLPAEGKALYHAFATTASPLLIAHLEAAQRLAESAGLQPALARRLLSELTSATLRNWQRNGPEQSFSGPIARGDAETLTRHIASLSGMPERDIYLALACYAAERLPARRIRALRAALKGGKPA